MEGRVRQCVRWIQARESQPVEFTVLPPAPAFVEALRSDTCGLLIPQTEMQFQWKRHIDIEEIAAPLPSSLRNHDREVIDRVALETGNRLISESCGDVPSSENVLMTKQQIKVALPAVPRIIDKVRAMAEDLEDLEL